MDLLDPELLAGIEQAARRVARRQFAEPDLARSRLVQGIHDISRRYTVEREPGGGVGRGALPPAPRLLFFTLADLPKLMLALAELVGAGRIPPRDPLRILDLGAGFGAQTLAVLAALDRPGAGRPLSIEVVDRDALALETLVHLVAECRDLGLGLGTQVLPAVRDLARQAPGAGPFDLIVAGNLINELPAPGRLPLLKRLLGTLRPDGHLIVLEPALRETTRDLHRLRDDLLAARACTVVAPCTRSGPCPALHQPDDWCHERRPWTAPVGVRALARASGLRRTDLKWSYLTLCPGGSALGDAWRVVSDPLTSKGKLELFLCGEQGRLRALRLNRHRSAANRPFQRLRRGHLVWLEGASESGGVLRIGGQTRVNGEDPTGPPRL